MNNTEIINFVNGRQYKSISNIEKLNKNSIMKDLDYDYSLNLQTKSKLSTVVNIYLSSSDLKEILIEPIKTLIQKKNTINLAPIEKNFKNIISSKIFQLYNLDILLPNGNTRDRLKRYGCIEYLKLTFKLEDKRFIKIQGEMAYRWFMIKHRPKIIQPKTIILSLDEADCLSSILENSIN